MKRIYLLLFIFLLLFASGCSSSKDDTTKVKKQSHEQDHHSPSKKKTQTTKSVQPPEQVTFTPEEFRERLRQVAIEYGIFDVSFLTDMESQNKSKESKKAIEPDSVLTGIIPNRLQIPSISLDAPVKTVGVLKNGQMKVPDDFSKVGLFAPWTKPGEKGSAVIAGHYDHYTGPAVFYRLKKVRPGDRVIVSDSKGNKRIFRVSSIERFKTKEAPKTRIFEESDQPYLNLVTCSGKFNRKTGDRPKRLVVFSKLDKDAS